MTRYAIKTAAIVMLGLAAAVQSFPTSTDRRDVLARAEADTGMIEGTEESAYFKVRDDDASEESAYFKGRDEDSSEESAYFKRDDDTSQESAYFKM